MKRVTVFLLLISVILMGGTILLAVPTVGEQSPGGGDGIHSVKGDLIVYEGEHTSIENDSFVLTGNIRVEGSLQLKGVTIYINSSYNGEYGIDVGPGGELEILDGTIIRPYGEKHYTFRVRRDNGDQGILRVEDSIVAGVGYPSTFPESTGIHISSKKVSILRSTFSGNHIGLLFEGVHGDIEIVDSLFEGNDYGIVVTDSGGFSLRGNDFMDNVRGLVVTRSSDLDISGNTFLANDYALKLDNSTDFSIRENTFKQNPMAGILVDFSRDGSILDNEINETRSRDEFRLGTAISLRGTVDTSITTTTLFHNDIGLMILHNNTGLEVEDIGIRGGKLGMVLYDQNRPSNYQRIRITDTAEAAFSAIHSANQAFSDVSFSSNQRRVLNITSSDIRFIQPEFDDLDDLDYTVDGKSIVYLSSIFRIHALELSGFPLSGSEVRVMNDGEVIYATDGYGGSDPLTDEQGYTGWIPADYTLLDQQGTDPGRIEITVRWFDEEMIVTTFGEPEDIVRLYFRIPDLTISDGDIRISPADPSNLDTVVVSATITNLGNRDIVTNVSLYGIPGFRELELDRQVETISLPTDAVLIDRTSVLVKDNGKRTVDFPWTPRLVGYHTLIVLIDRDLESLELRRDNNAAITHSYVSEGQALPGDKARISMIVPQTLNNTNITSSPFTLTLYLRNEGEVAGTINLRASLCQQGETILFHDEYLSILPKREITLSLEVTPQIGDALINFTLLQRVGEQALDILTPHVSIILYVKEGPPLPIDDDDDPLIPGVVLYSSTAGVISFCFAYVAFAESARYRFLLFFVPLYMRKSKKDIVEHYIRGEILGYIKQNPGESYNNIKRDLEMSNGKLAYHLSVLEKGSFIKSVTDGMYRRYYPKKMKVTVYGRITSVQEEILRRIEETPAITQKDLSMIVNLSTATINYHIRKLSQKGLITSKRTGIFIHYYLDGLTVEEIMANAISSSRRTSVKQ